MISEPMTLYKLMILYMLEEVNFPLTNSQLTGFFLDNGYTDYFTLQQVLSELIDSKLITDKHIGNSTRYEISSDGEETLGFFGKDISMAIRADMDEFLKKNKFRLRSEVGTTADYYKADSGNFIVHCEVREGKSMLISIDISVPDEKDAVDMAGNWKGESQEIYSNIMRSLMSPPDRDKN